MASIWCLTLIAGSLLLLQCPAPSHAYSTDQKELSRFGLSARKIKEMLRTVAEYADYGAHALEIVFDYYDYETAARFVRFMHTIGADAVRGYIAGGVPGAVFGVLKGLLWDWLWDSLLDIVTRKYLY